MTEYMKCGDGPWCEHCANKGEVEPQHVRYLCRNALGRCDFFRERPDTVEKDDAACAPEGESPA
jgi:hypothetical protein